MCSPLRKFCTRMKLKLKYTAGGSAVPNKLLVAAGNRPQSPGLCPHERSVLASFVIRFILPAPSFIAPGCRSLFCFDVYKPAKPQTPVQVESRRTVRGAAREPRLSFACSLSPPLSLRQPPSPAPSDDARMFTPVRRRRLATRGVIGRCGQPRSEAHEPSFRLFPIG